ncbi:tRNA dihydrouridine(20/20a) synthase DusA [Ruminobacter sp.]|uniref:tRNA dihydrouridine(20/20a) synthase DusA n=1 Tax=Ruminobacter sp. TaxID=2774296 RepID=UPI003865C81B
MTTDNYSRLSLAPMLDFTDRHFRYLCRILSKNMLLYTEMVTTGAIIYGKGDYLAFNEEEHPVSLQLGGANPEHLAICAGIGEDRGYDEINLNVGCPSDRVQNGSFGAVLMRSPDLVCDCIKAMKDRVSIPVTVKTRLGVDELDDYDYIHSFVAKLRDAGVDGMTIHARMAFLKGMSPRENRDKPPLNYERVYQLKRDFPDLHLSINGNITTIDDALKHLEYVDGVMIGRAIYQNPYMLVDVDERIFNHKHSCRMSRKECVRACYPYIENYLSQGGALKHISRHFLGMFNTCPNSRQFRQYMAQNHYKEGADISVLEKAMSFIPDEESSAE